MKLQKTTTEVLQAKRIIERLLKFRSRSEAELQNKLEEKGISQPVITETLDHFKRIGVIDDHLFARAWINSRLNKPFGLRRIRLELNRKGVSKEIVAQELAKAAADYDELGAAKGVAEKRLRQYQRLEPRKAKQRLSAYLIRRGFSAESIQKILREIH